jgi:hypothetical protein
VPRVAAIADIVLEHRAAALPRRVEAHVKWRRWRRYGV